MKGGVLLLKKIVCILKVMGFFKKREKQFEVKDYALKTPVPRNCLIELTNGCNHACVFCHNPKMERKISHLDIEEYKNFIETAVIEGVEEFGLYSTGEPFMTKNLEEFIKIAKEKGAKRVYITSNGALANLEKVKKCIDNGLDSIKFSINAGSKETYKIIHGHDDFDKVIFNLKEIYKYKKEKKINIQLLCGFVYTDLTYNEIDKFKLKFGKYFEDIQFYPTINQGGRTFDRLEKLNSLENYKKDQKVENKPCDMLWSRLHLTSEANLTACCVDYENDLVYKKFEKNEKLYDQFNSEHMIKLRSKHINNNLTNTICDGCMFNNNNNYEKLKNVEYQVSKPNLKKIDDLNKRIKQINK